MRQPAKAKAEAKSSRSKARQNPYKRSLNAFAIASAQTAEKSSKSHRLGVIEDEGKRTNSKAKPTNASNVEEEIQDDRGSDSEGHEWQLGVAGSDDSDIDSDEAFGESDEERFEGFTFRGSSGNTKAKPSKHEIRDLDLDEDESEDDADAEESLNGDEYVDLATMLDAGSSSEESSPPSKKRKQRADEEEEMSGSDFGSDSEESDDSDNRQDGSRLRNLVSSLPIDAPKVKRARVHDAIEMQPDSEFGITATKKLTVADMMASVTDPTIRKSLKLLDTSRDGSSRSKKNGARRLEVPLPQRQQDRVSRGVAYDKAKETLARWTDTIKLNRRADHLQFPLPGSSSAASQPNRKILNEQAGPITSLEGKVHQLMLESGLIEPKSDPAASEYGEDDEDSDGEFSELKANKLSLAEVQARRAELRLARELIFREEKRAKRVKKIKSKSYRRVLRRQNEKEAKVAEASLEAAGMELEDLEALELRRAEERVRSRHKDSKWAKSAKKAGRAIWDEDARVGMVELAQRQEDLSRRIQGKTIRNEDESQSTSENDEDSDEDRDEDDEVRMSLNKLNSTNELSDHVKSGLSSLKFMQKAEAALKAQNDKLVNEIRREMDGKPNIDEEVEPSGRRKYGPLAKSTFDDRDDIKGDEDNIDVYNSDDSTTHRRYRRKHTEDVEIITTSSQNTTKGVSQLQSKAKTLPDTNSSNPWLQVKQKISRETDGLMLNAPERFKDAKGISNSEILIDPKAILPIDLKKLSGHTGALPKTSLNKDIENESDQEDLSALLGSREELIKRAFAGDDVFSEFQKEKQDIMEDEDEKIVDNTIPGWGAWTGDGVSKKEAARNKGRYLTKQEGLKKEDRKDAKLDRVIINQKRVKKSTRYLASALPHPFETRQQYERSLRLPVGPEWTTKETFQRATKPRVLIKQGIIDPMSRPVI